VILDLLSFPFLFPTVASPEQPWLSLAAPQLVDPLISEMRFEIHAPERIASFKATVDS